MDSSCAKSIKTNGLLDGGGTVSSVVRSTEDVKSGSHERGGEEKSLLDDTLYKRFMKLALRKDGELFRT